MTMGQCKTCGVGHSQQFRRFPTMLKTIRQKFAHDDLAIFTVLFIASFIGLIASFVLSNEAVILARNENTVLACDLSSAVSCSAVGKHWSAEVFNFPNAFVGMISFSVMMTLAVAGILKVRFPRYFMLSAQAGAVVGVVFAGWMFYMSYVVIGALCPWCLLTDIAVLLSLYALNRYNVEQGHLVLSRKYETTLIRFVSKDFDKLAVFAVIVLMLVLILVKFGGTLF
ncbi:hypothetical protein B7Z28_00035 [Candidatus Saccharibacteria bacterium 32-45-3]|nr:MAG: hypothetical protein B7Z28_00035 [Candidatus Saccharibacteria bacterium 32-45-3]